MNHIAKIDYTQVAEKDQIKKKRISKSPEERKQEILDAAMELFVQKGYSNTTIQDIADHIGVSQGLCYRYFKSKSEMFTVASEHYALSAVEKIEIPFDKDMSSIDKLDFLLQEMYEYAIKSAEFDSISHSEGLKLVNAEVQMTQVNSFCKQLSNVLIDILIQGIEENEIVCKDIENTANFLAYGIVGAFHSDASRHLNKEYANNFIMAFRDLLIHSLQIKMNKEVGIGWLR